MLIILFASAAAMAQNPLARPDPFAGTFEGQQVVLELKGARGEYAGTISVRGQQFPVAVKANGANASGSFAVNGQSYPFTLSPAGDGLTLASEGQEYRLPRVGAAADQPPASGGVSGARIVGSWRNAQ